MSTENLLDVVNKRINDDVKDRYMLFQYRQICRMAVTELSHHQLIIKAALIVSRNTTM